MLECQELSEKVTLSLSPSSLILFFFFLGRKTFRLTLAIFKLFCDVTFSTDALSVQLEQKQPTVSPSFKKKKTPCCQHPTLPLSCRMLSWLMTFSFFAFSSHSSFLPEYKQKNKKQSVALYREGVAEPTCRTEHFSRCSVPSVNISVINCQHHTIPRINL